MVKKFFPVCLFEHLLVPHKYDIIQCVNLFGFLSFFILGPMAGVARKYIIGLAALVCWPFGWTIAAVVTNAMIAIGISATPIFIRLTRGQVLAAMAEDYVEAARAVGNPHWRIALRHVLPNVMPPLLVQVTLTIAAAVIAEASLSFLGLGQQPPMPSWGSMLNSAQRFLGNAPWMAIYPGLAIFITVLSFNVLGDGLRDALDPRLRS